jgi:hypothetical protein
MVYQFLLSNVSLGVFVSVGLLRSMHLSALLKARYVTRMKGSAEHTWLESERWRGKRRKETDVLKKVEWNHHEWKLSPQRMKIPPPN